MQNDNRDITMTEIRCITMYDEAKAEMVQTFENGVQLITCRKTGITGVFIAGELKSKYQYLPIDEYMDLQLEVQKLTI